MNDSRTVEKTNAFFVGNEPDRNIGKYSAQCSPSSPIKKSNGKTAKYIKIRVSKEKSSKSDVGCFQQVNVDSIPSPVILINNKKFAYLKVDLQTNTQIPPSGGPVITVSPICIFGFYMHLIWNEPEKFLGLIGVTLALIGACITGSFVIGKIMTDGGVAPWRTVSVQCGIILNSVAILVQIIGFFIVYIIGLINFKK